MMKRITSIIVALVMILSVAGITTNGSCATTVFADTASSDEEQYEYIMTIDPIPDQVLVGEWVYPKIIVRINGKALKQNQICVNYYNNAGVGYGYADVELVMDDMDPTDGIDFCGTDSIYKFNKIKETVKFKILHPFYTTTEGPIGDISKVKNYYYTGKPIIPEYKVWGSNVYLKKWILIKEGVDFTAHITNNIKPGRAEIAVTGITYSGTHYRTFKILKAPIKRTTVTGITDRYYSGKAQVQNKIKVTYNGKTLKKGRDYTVSYKNNKKAGKASVIIKGKGTCYTGTVTKTFNIVKGKVGKAVLTSAKSTDNNAIKLTWKKAKNAKKYQVWRATAKNGKYKLIKTSAETTFTNKNLTAGKKYYYKIRAINGTLKGKFSAVKSATPVPVKD